MNIYNYIIAYTAFADRTPNMNTYLDQTEKMKRYTLLFTFIMLIFFLLILYFSNNVKLDKMVVCLIKYLYIIFIYLKGVRTEKASRVK